MPLGPDLAIRPVHSVLEIAQLPKTTRARSFPPAGAGKPLAAEEEGRSDIADHHHDGRRISRTV
jgi:hypothetical protein